MTERAFAAVLFILFGCLLYIAASAVAHLVESRAAFGDVFMLLFCIIACVGWMTFLAGLCLVRPQQGPQARPLWKERAGYVPIEE
jgi:hypothetical protein